jgi:hypothetical protein
MNLRTGITQAVQLPTVVAMKSFGSEHILRYKVGELEDEKICIGRLHEVQSDAGDLIEMFIEPFEGMLDDLVGDNLIYFKKINCAFYRFSRFEQ